MVFMVNIPFVPWMVWVLLVGWYGGPLGQRDDFLEGHGEIRHWRNTITGVSLVKRYCRTPCDLEDSAGSKTLPIRSISRELDNITAFFALITMGFWGPPKVFQSYLIEEPCRLPFNPPSSGMTGGWRGGRPTISGFMGELPDFGAFNFMEISRFLRFFLIGRILRENPGNSENLLSENHGNKQLKL